MFFAERDTVMVLSITAIFTLAVVYSVFSATTISDNISTGGTLTVTGRSTFSDDASFTDVHASSTVQATGNAIFYANVGIGSTSPGANLGVNGSFLAQGTSTISGAGLIANGLFSTSSLNLYTNSNLAPRLTIENGGNVGIASSGPATTLSTIGSGYFTAGLGVGYATTGSGNLLVNDFLLVRAGRLGVNGTSSPSVEFGVTGSGLFSTGLGVGYATTGTGNLVVSDLAVFRTRVGVNASTSPYQEFGVTGDAVFGGAVGTSTVSLETTTSARGGCIELRDSDGRWVSIYAGRGAATNTSAHYIAAANLEGASGNTVLLVVETGRCEGGTD